MFGLDQDTGDACVQEFEVPRRLTTLPIIYDQ